MRLYSRSGNLTHRFPLIVEALGGLRSRSVILDGEAVACDDNGMSTFDRLRHRRHDASVFLYAFDLIELNGDDLRREPLEVRNHRQPHGVFGHRHRCSHGAAVSTRGWGREPDAAHHSQNCLRVPLSTLQYPAGLQEEGSDLVQGRPGRRKHCAARLWLPGNPAVCYRSRRSRVHLGNTG